MYILNAVENLTKMSNVKHIIVSLYTYFLQVYTMKYIVNNDMYRYYNVSIQNEYKQLTRVAIVKLENLSVLKFYNYWQFLNIIKYFTFTYIIKNLNDIRIEV